MRNWVFLTLLMALSFSNQAASLELMSKGYQLRLEVKSERGIWKNGDIVKSWYFKKATPCSSKSFAPFGYLLTTLKPWIQKKPSHYGEVRINQKTYYLKSSFKQLPGFFNEVEKVNSMILKKIEECS